MRMYTFYFCKADGSATTFEAYTLKGDDMAQERAALLVRQHPSCAYVAVFDADREVVKAHQPETGGPASTALISIGNTGVDPASLNRILSAHEVRHASVALIATTFDGSVVHWNPAAVRLYGWREDEAIGKDIVGLTPALQSRSKAEKIMKQLQAGVPWSGEITLRTRDGAPFAAFVADLPIELQGDRGLIVGASAPITGRTSVMACQSALAQELHQAFGK